MRSKLTEFEVISQRSNIIDGIDEEKCETRDECKEKVQEFLQDKLCLDYIEIEGN